MGVLGAVLSLVMLATSIVSSAPASSASVCRTHPTGGVVNRYRGLDAYSISVPDDLPRGRPVPLALMLHGLGSGGQAFAGRTGWAPFAAEHGVIVAFPSAPGRTWIRTKGSPDVAFIRRVVADIRTTECVDPHRIYVGGVSDGGFFASRLACDAADLVAAVAVVGGGDPSVGPAGGGCAPSEPVGVSFFHSTTDRFVSMSTAKKGRDAWVGRLRCGRTPLVERAPFGPLERFRGCTGRVEVMWRVYTGAPHAWPKGELQADLLDRMWRFFRATPN